MAFHYAGDIAADGSSPHLKSETDDSRSDATNNADPAVASLLITGLVATALAGAPHQIVVPDKLKAAIAAFFVTGALVLWLFRMEPSARVRWSLFLWAPLVLAASAFASVAWNPPGPAMVAGVRWVLIGVLILLGLNALDRDSFRGMARAAHWSAFILSLLALAEFWFELSLFPTEAPPGATFGNRNLYAEFLAVTLPFSLWLIARPSSPNNAAYTGLGLGVVVVGLMSTGTRAALIAGVVTLVVFVAAAVASTARTTVRPPSLAIGIGAAMALFVVAALGWLPSSNAMLIKEERGVTAIERATNRLSSLAESDTYADGSSFGVRKAAWEAGRKMITDNPVLGVGAGAWNAVSPLYSREDEQLETVWFAHNEPLQLIAEYGLAGWGALFALAWLAVRRAGQAGRQWQQRSELEYCLQTAVVLTSLAAFGVVSLSGLPLHASATSYLLALLIGWLLAVETGRVGTVGPTAHWRIARYAAATGLCATVIVSALALRSDYLVQRGGGLAAGLVRSGLPEEQTRPVRAEAINSLRQGFDIYPDHGLSSGHLAPMFLELGDPANALWLAELALQSRPHVAAIKCNVARAHTKLGRFDESARWLNKIERTRPKVPCLVIARMEHDFERGRFREVLTRGRAAVAGIGPTTDPRNARYLVDTTYRAAIRVPDVDAAIELLVLRADRWPDLKAGSWLLIGQLLATNSGAKVSEQAVIAFKNALHFASTPERAQIMARIPPPYQAAVK